MRRVSVLVLSALLFGLLASNEADAGGGYDAGKPYAAAKRAGGKYGAVNRGGRVAARARVVGRRAYDPVRRAKFVGPLGVAAYYDIGLTNDYGYGGECALVRHLRVWDGYTYRPTWAYPCSYY